MTPVPGQDAGGRWLPLLGDLTGASPSWCVWKNADRALAGGGDIDSAAPYAEWDALASVHRAWARSNHAIAGVACRHTPGLLSLVVAMPESEALLQLDLFAETFWRGSRLFVAEQLAPLMVLDTRGFRRIRPGAEGVFLFLFNGVRRTAGPDVEAIRRKGVGELLRTDWDGAIAAARVLQAPRSLIRALHAVREGRWDTRAVLATETRALVRSFSEEDALGRLRFRSQVRFAPCPVDRALRNARRVPRDVEAWLGAIRSANDPHDSILDLR
jgi:hypothetical protein